MATKWNPINSNTESRRKVNLILFSFQLKFLNLSAKKSSLETMSKEKTSVIAISIQLWYNQPPTVFEIKGNDVIKSVLEGVFKPLKESVCVSSTLKIANRKAEKTAMMNPT